MGRLDLISLSVVVGARRGKELPDLRQNERRIKFIKVGDTLLTSGQLKEEPTPFMS